MRPRPHGIYWLEQKRPGLTCAPVKPILFPTSSFQIALCMEIQGVPSTKPTPIFLNIFGWKWGFISHCMRRNPVYTLIVHMYMFVQ